MSVTRRLFVSAIAGGVVASATSKPRVAETEWITVAHGGLNLNGHLYPPEEIRALYEQLYGAMVGRSDNQRLLSLDQIAGVVTYCSWESTYNPDKECREYIVKVMVDWFTPTPVGSFLTPVGHAKAFPHAQRGSLVIRKFELHFLDVSPSSAFQYATSVPEAARVG